MRLLHLALLLTSTLTLTNVSAAIAEPKKKAKSSATAPAAKPRGAMPKFIPSASQESTRDRERRLLRECKGRPNAGACSGFTS
jgi:hypothetical protein